MSIAPITPAEAPFTYRIRPLGKGEQGLVFGTWIRSYMTSADARRVESEDYFQGQLRLIESILARGGIVRVAEHDVHGTLLGYGVGERHEERPVLHYFYVKGDYRHHGVGRALEVELLKVLRKPGETVRYTHRQREFVPALAAKRGYRWNPFCNFPPKET